MEEKSEKGKRPLASPLFTVKRPPLPAPPPPPGKFILIFLSRGDDSMDFTRGHSRQSPFRFLLLVLLLLFFCIVSFVPASAFLHAEMNARTVSRKRASWAENETIIIQRRRALKRLVVRRRPVSYRCASAIRGSRFMRSRHARYSRNPSWISDRKSTDFLRLSPRRDLGNLGKL